MLFRTYARAAEAAVADLPGGPRGYQVLAAAAAGKVNSQLELARILGIDRTVMTYLLDDLEQRGLIERQPDPADRRARRVTATEKGTEVLGALDERLRAAEAYLMAPLDEEAVAAFRAQVQILARHANAADPPGPACAVAEQAPQFAATVQRTARGRYKLSRSSQ